MTSTDLSFAARHGLRHQFIWLAIVAVLGSLSILIAAAPAFTLELRRTLPVGMIDVVVWFAVALISAIAFCWMVPVESIAQGKENGSIFVRRQQLASYWSALAGLATRMLAASIRIARVVLDFVVRRPHQSSSPRLASRLASPLVHTLDSLRALARAGRLSGQPYTASLR